MRRQNPPQASLDQALVLEQYLNPLPLGVIYALCAIAGFVTITILFAILALYSLVNPTGSTTVIVALLALSPAALALIEFHRRPDDLLSTLIRSFADSRREPIGVAGDRCSFKVLLRTGEALCANLTFCYPARYHGPDVQERILGHVRLALERDASLRTEAPSDSEVMETVDRALETVATELNIPVLYSEVRDLHKIRDEYSRPDRDLTPSEYLGVATGTLG